MLCKLLWTIKNKEKLMHSLLMLNNKLPQNLVALNNKHLLSQILWLRNPGAAQLDGSESASLIRQQPDSQPGLQSSQSLTGGGSASEIIYVAIGSPQFLAGCWLEISVSCHMSHLLASPRASDPREGQKARKHPRWKPQSFIT